MRCSTLLLINVILLPLCVLLFDGTHFIGCFIFLASFICCLYFLKEQMRENIFNWFSPCVMALIYTNVNNIFGPIFFHNEWILDQRFLSDVNNIRQTNIEITYIYFLVCNTILCFIARNKYIQTPRSSNAGTSPKKLWRIVVLCLIFILLQIVDVNLSFMGASSNSFNYPFLLATAAGISYELCMMRYKTVVRLAFYAVLLSIFVVQSVESKRELFFVAIAILIIEMVYMQHQIRFDFRIFLYSLAFVCLSAFTILVQSILRGYGNFQVETVSDAVDVLPTYVQSDYFMPSLANNFEYSYSYGHEIKAMDYILQGQIEPLFGETFLKVFFLPLPRQLVGYKPKNMMDVYTGKYAPEFRAIGGSYPVSVFVEFFANFHIVGLCFMALFFSYFEKKFFQMRAFFGSINPDNRITGLYFVIATAMFIQFVRGSGLDQYVLYTLMSVFMLWLLKKLKILM